MPAHERVRILTKGEDGDVHIEPLRDEELAPGDQVVAVIALKAGATATSGDLLRFCREKLANYKCPRRVVVRASLPRSETGKILKRLLKKEMELESPLT